MSYSLSSMGRKFGVLRCVFGTERDSHYKLGRAELKVTVKDRMINNRGMTVGEIKYLLKTHEKFLAHNRCT